jgi:hypothetical protein
MNSLVSANGPSLSRVCPSRARTVTAVLGCFSACPYLRTPRASISSIQRGMWSRIAAAFSSLATPSLQISNM